MDERPGNPVTRAQARCAAYDENLIGPLKSRNADGLSDVQCAAVHRGRAEGLRSAIAVVLARRAELGNGLGPPLTAWGQSRLEA
jgi:hypothetical protein